MNDNVVSFKKMDLFDVHSAAMTSSGELMEGKRLGLAFLKPGSKMFRLSLWMFPDEPYFIAASEDRSTYKVLCPNDSGGKSTHWNEVGSGHVSGPFICLKLYLIDQEILVRLYPKATDSEVLDEAA